MIERAGLEAGDGRNRVAKCRPLGVGDVAPAQDGAIAVAAPVGRGRTTAAQKSAAAMAF